MSRQFVSVRPSIPTLVRPLVRPSIRLSVRGVDGAQHRPLKMPLRCLGSLFGVSPECFRHDRFYAELSHKCRAPRPFHSEMHSQGIQEGCDMKPQSAPFKFRLSFHTLCCQAAVAERPWLWRLCSFFRPLRAPPCARVGVARPVLTCRRGSL